MKFIVKLLLMGILAAGLAGCGGAQQEKIEEAQGVYNTLVTRHNEVIEAYAAVEDDTYSKTLNEMSDKINLVGQKDLKGFSGEEIDAIIADLNANLTTYDEIMDAINELKNTATERKGIPVTIKNNTSVNLYELYLYQNGSKQEKTNLVGEMEYLGGYDTFNIVEFYLENEEEPIILEAVDEGGKLIESEEIDLSAVGEDGITIRMEYSFETMEGEIVLE